MTTPNDPNDQCPAWADRMLRQIHEIEVRLGNLHAPGDKYTESDLEELARRSFSDDELAGDDGTTEALFTKVARGLRREGFGPAAIAAFVNARVGPGGRLAYCNEAEVLEALSSPEP